MQRFRVRTFGALALAGALLVGCAVGGQDAARATATPAPTALPAAVASVPTAAPAPTATPSPYSVAPLVFSDLPSKPPADARRELVESGEYCVVSVAAFCRRLGWLHDRAGQVHTTMRGERGIRWTEGTRILSETWRSSEWIVLPFMPAIPDVCPHRRAGRLEQRRGGACAAALVVPQVTVLTAIFRIRALAEHYGTDDTHELNATRTLVHVIASASDKHRHVRETPT